MTEALPGTRGRRRIYLMRHGEVTYFDRDGKPVHPKHVQLTEDGEAQAREMGRMLAGVTFERAACSGLPRTRQTAELVLAGRGLELEERPALKEIRAGDYRHKSPAQIEAAFVYGMENAAAPGARFADGDSYAEFYARVTGDFLALLREPGWRTMLIVAHEGTNRMILGWVSGGGLVAISAFEQDPSCLNIIDADLVDGEIERRFLKLMNATPANHAKHGNFLTSMEQVFALRRQRMARPGD